MMDLDRIDSRTDDATSVDTGITARNGEGP
jgi:hypothetical protein